MDNKSRELVDKAWKVIFPKISHYAPEVVQEYGKSLLLHPAKWPWHICCWLRGADANFWNQYLPPPPPENE